jgi:hypothetical protein
MLGLRYYKVKIEISKDKKSRGVHICFFLEKKKLRTLRFANTVCAKKIAPLFGRIYRYVPKGIEVFSLQVLSSFMFGLQDLEKKTLKM